MHLYVDSVSSFMFGVVITLTFVMMSFVMAHYYSLAKREDRRRQRRQRKS